MVRTVALFAGIVVMLWMVLVTTPAPRTHADAITQLLHHYDVPVRSVTVTQSWPNALPFYAYGHEAMPYQAAVTIELITEHQMNGFLVCNNAPLSCQLTFRELMIISEPIADIAHSPSLFEQVYAWVMRLRNI